MTANYFADKKRWATPLLSTCLCIIIFIIAIYYGGALKSGAVYGLKICFLNIIPTLFPFFILSDLWSSAVSFPENTVFSSIIKKAFNISSEGVSAILVGTLCGFPLGAKTATEKWEKRLIGNSELENLSTLCNNPSPAFIISGVGAGLLGDINVGLALYFSTIASAIIVGLIFKEKEIEDPIYKEKTEQSFDLINSIKNAGTSSITVASYIIFFSSIIGLCREFCGNPALISVISSFLEIGSSCSIIAENQNALGIFYLPLLSFTLSFSGLSVFLQIFSILPPFVSKRKYIAKKLLQGAISALLTFLILCI